MDRRSWRLIVIVITGIAATFLLSRLFPASTKISILKNDEKVLAAYCKEKFNKSSSNSQEKSSVVPTKKTTKYIPSLDEDWGQLKCPSTPLSKDQLNLFEYINEITLPCEFSVMLGGFYDGGNKAIKPFFAGEKYVCLDEYFNITWRNCICLSFGIGGDWTFDDDLDKKIGCKIYAFDPTIGAADHDRSANIKFFHMGISDKPGKLGTGKLETYSGILKMLNMENTVIDYLKIDTEGAEWAFFKDILTNTPNLLKKVKQIGMEIHIGEAGADNATAWRYFQHLDCLGFKIMFLGNHPFFPKQKINGNWVADLFEIVWGQERKW